LATGDFHVDFVAHIERPDQRAGAHGEQRQDDYEFQGFFHHF
jgi:hypothetical protein